MKLDTAQQPYPLPIVPPSRKLQIAQGKQGTRQTLQLMKKLVQDARTNGLVRQLALQLVSGLAQKDYLGEAKKIHEFVRDKIRYVRDPNKVEALHTVEQLLVQRQGDCDDKTVLVAALLEAIGHKTRIKAIGFKRGFCHVYPEVNIKGVWYAVETTEPWIFGQVPKQAPDLIMVENV
jgi:transglutaminase-like putative cysteine protease